VKETVVDLAENIPLNQACAAVGYPRSSFYREQQPAVVKETVVRPPSFRALTAEEQEEVMEVLHSERFQDSSPREVYATLLDEGVYHCSWRTMYRLLKERDESQERRQQRQHPAYSKPELLATAPNQLWSWDITKMRGPVTWSGYYLYVIMDVFSRYVVGWMIAEQELATLAEQLIAECCDKQQIQPDQLTLHADRGSSMTSKTVAQLLADLGVSKTHSRPHTSNDNPYSEAQFKTMKYRPDYPARFGSLEDARAWARPFFHWYNHDHHHVGLGLMTPVTVHTGLAPQTLAARQHHLAAAYEAHPERFVQGPPLPPALPEAVWINPPVAQKTQ